MSESAHSAHSAHSAYSPEAPSRWKQQLSLLKRREASQLVIDAATRDEEVVFSPMARSFAESIDFDRIDSHNLLAQVQLPKAEAGGNLEAADSSSSSSSS